MNNLYSLVVFDWEGTIGEDTLGHVLNVLSIEALRLNFGEIDKRITRQYVALGLERAVKKILPELTLYQHEQLLEAVQASLVTSSTDTFLIPGAIQIISALDAAGVLLGIATNKGHIPLQRAMQASELVHFFTETRSASQVPAKPCPKMLEELMEACGARHDETLMIGDSVVDIEMAVSIGVDAIGVDFYHVNEVQLRAAGAQAVFDNYERVADYLQLGDKEL